MALPSGITHHWGFKDGSGTTITDIVGSADLTLNGTTTNFWDRKDVNGDAVGQFNGSDNTATDEGPNVSFPTGDWWLIVALRVDRGADWNDNRGIWRYRNESGDFNGIELMLDDTDGFRLVVSDGTAVTLNFGMEPELTDAWIIVQAGYEDFTGNIFLRVEDWEKTETGADLPEGSIDNMVMGKQTASAEFFLGRIGDTIFYDGKFPTEQEKQAAFDALWGRYNGSDITVNTDDSSISPTKTSGPYDGERIVQTRGQGTQIFSGGGHVYVAEYINRSPDGDQVRVARLNSSYEVQEDVQVTDGTPSSEAGHRLPAVARDSNGNVVVVANPEGTWSLMHTTSADDLSTLTATDRPVEVEATDELTHGRLFYDSTIYLLLRNNTQDANLWLFEYDAGANTWSSIGGDPFTAHDASIDRTYTHSGIAFHTSGETTTIYVLLSRNISGTNGYLNEYLQAIKTVDGGSNWTDLLSNSVNLPWTKQGSPVVPVARDSSTPETTERANLVIGSAGQPIVVAPWRSLLQEDSNMHWWLFRWNETAETITRHRLVETSESVWSGWFNLVRGTGDQIVFAYLDPDDDVLKVLVTEDDGDTWERWILDDVSTNPAALAGDQNSINADGVYRFLTVRHDDINLESGTAGDTSVSDIYEFAPSDLAAVELAGTTQGSATTQGAIVADLSLSGTAQGEATPQGALAVDRPLSGVMTGEATTQGALEVAVSLSGTAPGQGDAAGSLTLSASLSGTIQGQAVLSGDLSVAAIAATTIQGAGSHTPTIQGAGSL